MSICGIDMGTTNLKVALFDDANRMIWIKSVPTPRIEDRFGVATDVRKLVEMVEDLVIEGWAETGRRGPILAISTAGVGEDGVYLGESLEPIPYSIPWFDMRASAEATELAQSDAATPSAGIEMEPTRTAALWLWTSKIMPETSRQADRWLCLTDYPLAKWAKKDFVSDTLASRTGCFNPTTREWIEPLLRESRAPALPHVVSAGTVIGTMKSERLLSSGAVDANTLLVAGGHDHPVAAHAIHKLAADARVDSMGTANVIYGDAPRFETTAFDPQIAFTASIEGPEKVGCLGVFEFTGAVNKFSGGMEAIRREMALPKISGTPGDPALSRFATERHLLEWATFNARRMLEKLERYGVPEGPVYATGGWSRSRALLELRASIFGRQIYVPEERELSVLGAALFAAEATGQKATFDTSVSIIEPDSAWMTVYGDLYGQFLEHRN
jgi:xylulokinase